MYICLCNCLKDSDMADAISKGANCVSDVYGYHGCKPQCGRCVPYVEETLGTSASLEFKTAG